VGLPRIHPITLRVQLIHFLARLVHVSLGARPVHFLLCTSATSLKRPASLDSRKRIIYPSLATKTDGYVGVIHANTYTGNSIITAIISAVIDECQRRFHILFPLAQGQISDQIRVPSSGVEPPAAVQAYAAFFPKQQALFNKNPLPLLRLV
jgi:hypothetical protein